MKRAFLSRSYAHRHEMLPVVDIITQAAAAMDINVYDFVTVNQFEAHEMKLMMQTSFSQIQAADLLIAEVSVKAIGVGIEVGYAAALNKPILALRGELTEHSTTVSGTATVSLTYVDGEALRQVLPQGLRSIINLLG